MKRISSFKDVLLFLDTIEDINSGGCGISALSMHLWTKANRKTPYNFKFVSVYQYSSKDRYINNEMCLINNDSNFVAPTHVMYCINGRMWDSEGSQSMKDYPYSLIIESEENLITMINNENAGWNNSFQRAIYVPYIEKVLNIDLSCVNINTKNFSVKNKAEFEEKQENNDNNWWSFSRLINKAFSIFE